MGDGSFDPPSDFEPDDASGGGGSNIWMWVGLGCFGLLLIAGLVLSLGAYQTVSCCQQTIEQQRELIQTSTSFGRHLADGQFERAWSMTSPTFRAETSLDDFKKKLDPYRAGLEGANVRPQNIDSNMKRGGKIHAQVALAFLQPNTTQKVVVTLELVPTNREQSASERDPYKINGFSIERRERDFSKEPPARDVSNFHLDVSRGEVEQAYQEWMSREYRENTGVSAFKTFVDEQSEWMTRGEIEISKVSYPDDGTAIVLARHTVPNPQGDGATREVSYRLKQVSSREWRITEITPEATSSGTSPDSPSRREQGAPDRDVN